jgi:hypothetical protein
MIVAGNLSGWASVAETRVQGSRARAARASPAMAFRSRLVALSSLPPHALSGSRATRAKASGVFMFASRYRWTARIAGATSAGRVALSSPGRLLLGDGADRTFGRS